MARPRTGRKGSSTNLYFADEIREKGAKLAKERYGLSLSSLVGRLILAELKRKRGIAHMRLV